MHTLNHGCYNEEWMFDNQKPDNEWHTSQHLPNKSSNGKHTKDTCTSVKEDIKEEQTVCTKEENLTNATDIGMNATHICGILMEPVNVNYTRNIYFTVKITHKYYTNRLLLLMLTWLQTVDKNEVHKLQWWLTIIMVQLF